MKVFRLNRLPLFLAVFYLLMELPTIPAAEVTGFASRVKEPRGQSLAVIVNQANPTENLSFAELRKIFLGERSHWPHGRRITVAMLEEGRPERGAVLREIYKMSEAGYRDHFLKGLFTGEVLFSPKTLSSPIAVRKFVFNAPGAIGCVRTGDVNQSVKVVRIDGRLPNEKDYRLQIDAPLADSAHE